MFTTFKKRKIHGFNFSMKACKEKKTFGRTLIAVVLSFLVLAGMTLMITGLYAQEEERVSGFGEYKGYSKEIYDSWVRISQYITSRDGTRLAADIFRPAKNGQPVEEALPVLWTHTRYRRAFVQDGKLITMLRSRYLQTLLKHGYVIAAVDVRGAGASFGTWQGTFTKEETQDAYDIIEWLGKQSWCDGNVGMYGGSYLGITQLMAASTDPPHLKAIFPVVALFDLYDIGYPGGIYRDDFLKTWSELTRLMDTDQVAAPVDDDKDGALLKETIKAHQSNVSLYESMTSFPFRNSEDDATGIRPGIDWSPSNFIKEINESGVAIYLWGGWFDSFTRDQFLWFRNLEIPKRMTIGPWSHNPRDESVRAELFKLAEAERLRWFDYWLKGIDNGIMDEAPITYHTMGAQEGSQWRTAQEWPLPGEYLKSYYFHQGPSGSMNSTNDGVLLDQPPTVADGKDDYVVDYTTTSGQNTRWDNAVGGGFEYPDMTPNDSKALTYTTAPLVSNVEITGHPVVHLWVSSTAGDGDFFAYLEEVDAEGASHYITEGVLRASHRGIHEPPYDYVGLPFHRSFDEDFVKLTPGELVELVFDLHPTSNVFDAGNRIRVTITCADKDNALTPELSPAPEVSLYRNADHASYISLPVITPAEEQGLLALGLVLFVIIILIVLIIVLPKMRRKSA